jgi:predicted ATPase/DNA-binding winged helix-turn-helix (wHTH) protein
MMNSGDLRQSPANGNFDAETVTFGPFRLIPSQRKLEKDGVAVALGARAFDILLALLERPQQVVTKRELFDRVWPGVHVDESSLRVHVSALRKALEGGGSNVKYITNVSGRGYCFAFAVTAMAAAPVSINSEPFRSRLPVMPAEIVGRESAIKSIASQLIAQRFVSIVGSGGVGKTTTAISVAHSLSDTFADGVCFVDLGLLGDPQSVAFAVASSTNVSTKSSDLLESLLAALSRKRTLIVLDGCEHVAEAAAGLAEAILRRCPDVHLLATSRESLRADGECVHRLQPLECPPDVSGMTASELLEYPAARLFVGRLSTRGVAPDIAESDVPTIAAICRRLDGIALALELVAGRVDTFGITGIASLLDSDMALHLSGKRTAVPRHRTLSATIDWSYRLLAENERVVLRRLSVFTGPFSFEAARRVVIDANAAAANGLLEEFSALVAKSLIAVVVNGSDLRYRLLDTTRARLRHHLIESGEAHEIAVRHADYYCDRIEKLSSRTHSSSVYDVDREEAVSNIRTALEFAFSSDEASVDKLRIAASATRLFLDMSLLIECREWAERGVAIVGAETEPSRYALELWTALALSRMFTDGEKSATHSALMKALDLSEAVNDTSYKLRILSGLQLFSARVGDFQSALTQASNFHSAAEKLGNPEYLSLSEAMLGAAYHLAGDQAKAQIHSEAAYGSFGSAQDPKLLQYGYDNYTRSLGTLARVYWLRGHASKAVSVAHEAVNQGRKLDHPVTLCMSLMFSAWVFHWAGDHNVAWQIIDDLQAQSEKYSLIPFLAAARGLAGRLLTADGDQSRGIACMREGLDLLRGHRHQLMGITVATGLAEGLVAGGENSEALAIVDSVLKQDAEGGGSWYTPEVLRVRGLALAGLGRARYADAVDSLAKSLELARTHSSLAFELRAAIDMTCLGERNGGGFDRALLGEVCDRFLDARSTPDLTLARSLLAKRAKKGAAGGSDPTAQR